MTSADPTGWGCLFHSSILHSDRCSNWAVSHEVPETPQLSLVLAARKVWILATRNPPSFVVSSIEGRHYGPLHGPDRRVAAAKAEAKARRDKPLRN
jgi:hypothetical protein